MKQLKEYCMKICYINGIKTYIISPQYYEEIVADADLLASLFIAEYSCAAEPPVQCSVSHLSRRSAPQ